MQHITATKQQSNQESSHPDKWPGTITYLILCANFSQPAASIHNPPFLKQYTGLSTRRLIMEEAPLHPQPHILAFPRDLLTCTEAYLCIGMCIKRTWSPEMMLYFLALFNVDCMFSLVSLMKRIICSTWCLYRKFKPAIRRLILACWALLFDI